MKVLQGKFVSWDQAKGFGFIRHQAYKKDIYINQRELNNPSKPPLIGSKIQFVCISKGQQIWAVDAAKYKQHHAYQRKLLLQIILALVWLIGLFTAGYWHYLSPNFALYYLACSGITFIAYGVDKNAAKKGRWRTKEKTLQLLALIGGWPGAIIGRHWFAHKRQKLSFRVIFWLAAIINIIAFVFILEPQWLLTLTQSMA